VNRHRAGPYACRVETWSETNVREAESMWLFRRVIKSHRFLIPKHEDPDRDQMGRQLAGW
jgi:hypothetical protein